MGFAKPYFRERVIGHLVHKPSDTHFYICRLVGVDAYDGYAILPGKNYPITLEKVVSEDLVKGNWIGGKPMTREKDFYVRNWDEAKSVHFPCKPVRV